MKKSIRKAPHWRTSKRGRKFRAGRGIKRASQLLRDKIRRESTINTPPKEKEKLIRLLEKHPETYKNYKESGRIPISTNPYLFENDGVLGRKITHKQKKKWYQPFKKPEYTHGIELDNIIFKSGFAPHHPSINSKMPATPKTVLDHEFGHVLLSQEMGEDNVNKYLSAEFQEELADNRALVDIRKIKLPQATLNLKTEQGMRWLYGQ